VVVSNALPALLLLATTPVFAGWWEVYQADAQYDLTAARREALATVAADPKSADAIAAAGWWLENLSSISDPGSILDAAGDRARDPELSFTLARIEGSLLDRPPMGSLATVEIAGPFGRFDTLDLERDVVPPDGELPPIGTVWRGDTSVYRLLQRTATGTVAPPDSMDVGGVYLAAWTVVVDRRIDGWLALEAQGGVNLEVDSRPVARLRDCGSTEPGVTWYRMVLDRGRHRIRVAMGSPRGPRVRVSVFGRTESKDLEGSSAGVFQAEDTHLRKTFSTAVSLRNLSHQAATVSAAQIYN